MIYLLLIVCYSLLLYIAFIPKVHEVMIEQGLEETQTKSTQEEEHISFVSDNNTGNNN